MARDHRPREVGGVARDLGDDAVGDRLLQALPGPGRQVTRAVLHEAGHDVLPGRRARGVEHRVDAGLDGRASGERAALAVVPGPLDEIDGRAEVQEAAVLRAGRLARHRREIGQLGQCQVHLERRAQVFETLHVLHEGRGQRALGQQLEKGAARRGVADDDVGLQDLAVREPHAGGAAGGVELDRQDRRPGPDGHPALARRGRQRLGDHAHAADDHAPDSGGPVHAAEHVVQQQERGARLVHSAVGADDGLRAQERLEGVGLEPGVEDVGDAETGELDERLQVVARQPARGEPHLQELPQVARGPAVETRRRLQEERLHERPDTLEHGVELVIPIGVAAGEFGDLLHVPVVAVQRQRPPVRVRHEEGGVLADDLVAVPRQIEPLHRLRQQQRADVRGRGDLVAGEQLLRHAGAADNRARLEHRDPVATLGQEVRRHQAVVTRADDRDPLPSARSGHQSPLAISSRRARHPAGSWPISQSLRPQPTAMK